VKTPPLIGPASPQGPILGAKSFHGVLYPHAAPANKTCPASDSGSQRPFATADATGPVSSADLVPVIALAGPVSVVTTTVGPAITSDTLRQSLDQLQLKNVFWVALTQRMQSFCL
jgi:hypothetical protein